MRKGKTLTVILLSIIPVIALTLYFNSLLTTLKKPAAIKRNLNPALETEKKLAVSVASKNAWYFTMLLRKVEQAGRLLEGFSEKIIIAPGAFSAQKEIEKIQKTDNYYWNPGKSNSLFFAAGLNKEKKIPLLPEYFDDVFSIINKNAPGITSIYVITDKAVRRHPWENIASEIKTGGFKLGQYNVTKGADFSADENSPYVIAGPKKNKTKTDLWTPPYWDKKSRSFAMTYLNPVYRKDVYLGVIGIEVDMSDLMLKVTGPAQDKKFYYEDSFPMIVSSARKIVSASDYGYEKLSVSKDDPKRADLGLHENLSVRAAAEKMSGPESWDSKSVDSDLGGIDKLRLSDTDYYISYFPIRTANLTFAIMFKASNIENSAVAAVEESDKTSALKEKARNAAVLAVLIIIFGFIVLSFMKEGSNPYGEADISRKAEEIANIMFDEERKDLNQKVFEVESINKRLEKEVMQLEIDIKAFIESKGKNISEEEYNRINSIKKSLEEKITALETAKTASNAELEELRAKLTCVNNDDQEKLKQENEKLVKEVTAAHIEAKEITIKMLSKFEQEKEAFKKSAAETAVSMKRYEHENQILKDKVTESEIENIKYKEELKKLAERTASEQGISSQSEFQQQIEAERKNYTLALEKAAEEKAKLADNIKKITADSNALKERLNFLETTKAGIDKQTRELILKFEEEKRGFNQKISELNEELKLSGLKNEAAAQASKEKSKVILFSGGEKEKKAENEKNILVVDDKGEIIKIFGDLLYSLGFSIYIARNTKLAYQKLAIGNYRSVLLNANISDSDYKEFYDGIKKVDEKAANEIIFYVGEEQAEDSFFKTKNTIRSSSAEDDIKKILNEGSA